MITPEKIKSIMESYQPPREDDLWYIFPVKVVIETDLLGLYTNHKEELDEIAKNHKSVLVTFMRKGGSKVEPSKPLDIKDLRK